jgi:hypothetical protein
VSRSIVELLRQRPGRGISAETCAALYVFFAATLTAAVTIALARWGSLWRWPIGYRAALFVVSIGGSCSWWWVNGSVEGRILFSLAPNRGVTIADLLVVPALLLAALLLVTSAWPRLRALA